METFLAVGGAIVLMGNVGAVIHKIIKPSLDMRYRVGELEKHDKADFERIKAMESLNKAQCKMLLVMIDHMIDGNHVETMKDTRNQIIEMMARQGF